ncbi:hypothetical protein NVV94_12970 [Pseudomonas sp. LS1212]|uniref:hypothetical protein n=1 Tax=Pseudomonas sp. LS1212 TaxID=2972478 RepID=UPI00215CE750|nr:hypothetical protein [Pseudomonas sp. LS1212]UVJ46357.1 hypothetical protein NVV94_12970 [Pseudomonas sp. LS1212]
MGHLQLPGDTQQAKESIERLQQMLGQKLQGVQSGVDALQDSMGMLLDQLVELAVEARQIMF